MGLLFQPPGGGWLGPVEASVIALSAVRLTDFGNCHNWRQLASKVESLKGRGVNVVCNRTGNEARNKTTVFGLLLLSFP